MDAVRVTKDNRSDLVLPVLKSMDAPQGAFKKREFLALAPARSKRLNPPSMLPNPNPAFVPKTEILADPTEMTLFRRSLWPAYTLKVHARILACLCGGQAGRLMLDAHDWTGQVWAFKRGPILATSEATSSFTQSK